MESELREHGLQMRGVLWAGLLTEVIDALTAMAGANAAAPSGPRVLLNRLSCAQERDRGGHRSDGQGGSEPRVEVHAAESR